MTIWQHCLCLLDNCFRFGRHQVPLHSPSVDPVRSSVLCRLSKRKNTRQTETTARESAEQLRTAAANQRSPIQLKSAKWRVCARTSERATSTTNQRAECVVLSACSFFCVPGNVSGRLLLFCFQCVPVHTYTYTHTYSCSCVCVTVECALHSGDRE